MINHELLSFYLIAVSMTGLHSLVINLIFTLDKVLYR